MGRSERLYEYIGVMYSLNIEHLQRCGCKGKQSALSEATLTHTGSSSGPSSSSSSSYSPTCSPFPASSYMLLSAQIQDEASVHVGISPNSWLSPDVGEDARLSERLFITRQGDEKDLRP